MGESPIVQAPSETFEESKISNKKFQNQEKILQLVILNLVSINSKKSEHVLFSTSS